MIEDRDILVRYMKKKAILLAYINPQRFLSLHTVNNFPLNYVSPLTQRELERKMKYCPLKIYYDPVKGRDVGHDGRNRAVFLLRHKVRRAKVVILFVHHFRPIPVNEVSQLQLQELREGLGVYILGKPRRLNEIVTTVKVK